MWTSAGASRSLRPTLGSLGVSLINLPHVRTRIDSDGHVLVTVDDYEVFDFVDDHLTENHELDYLWVEESSGKPARYPMTCEGELAERIEIALSGLDAAQLEAIYLINNPEQPT